MTFANFIPEMWDAELLINFHEQTIAAALANRQYEGTLASGNTVHISTAVDVTVKDYKHGVASDGSTPRTTAPDAVDITQLDLVIDQEKSFDFLVDDIDRVQAAGSMGAFTETASLAMAEDADKFLLTQWVGASSAPDSSKASLSTGDDAYDVLRDLRKALNKALVPKSSRYAICNAEFEAVLLDASSKLMAANTAGTTQAFRDGLVGNLLGFTIVTSENLPVTAHPQCLGLWAPAVAYVSQVDKTEPMRDIDSFSDRLRGLHVYGGKVIRPIGLAAYTATA